MSNPLKTATAPLIVAVLCLFTASLAFASTAQEARKTSPELGNAHPTGEGALQTRKATLQELYAMFFAFAAHVEDRSNSDERSGMDRSFYRQHLQIASGLTPDEYAHVLKTAREFLAADAEIEGKIAEWNKTVLGDGGNPPASSVLGSSSYQTELARLFALRQSTLESAIERLREALGSDRSQVLEAYLEGSFSNPVIGTESTGGASGAAGSPAPAASPDVGHQLNLRQLSSPKQQLSASPESVTIGGSATCTNFTNSIG